MVRLQDVGGRVESGTETESNAGAVTEEILEIVWNNSSALILSGEVSEWLMELAWKACKRLNVSRV